MTRVTDRFINEGWVEETPSGSINGSNTSFTLSFQVDDTADCFLWVNGLLNFYTTHYTISGTTLTMTYGPATDSDLRIKYQKKL
jgi:hypothetical protein